MIILIILAVLCVAGIIFHIHSSQTPKTYIEVQLVKDAKEIQIKILGNGPNDFIPSYQTYIYGYQDGYLKLCCFGGTAYKIKCEEEDVEKLIEPVKNNMQEGDVVQYCLKGGWEYWDYYTDYYKREEVLIK